MARVEPALRLSTIAGFTLVETVALAAWLEFVHGEPAISIAVAIGVGVLVAGLFVEHAFTDFVVNGIDLDVPLGSLIGFSVSETVLWSLWLATAGVVGGGIGALVAFVLLGGLLVPQHTIEDNFLQGRTLFDPIVDRRTTGFSLIEAGGATLWLVLVEQPALVGGGIAGVGAADLGLVVLAVTLFIEHLIGVGFFSR